MYVYLPGDFGQTTLTRKPGAPASWTESGTRRGSQCRAGKQLSPSPGTRGIPAAKRTDPWQDTDDDGCFFSLSIFVFGFGRARTKTLGRSWAGRMVQRNEWN